jgi:hypothetical protein
MTFHLKTAALLLLASSTALVYTACNKEKTDSDTGIATDYYDGQRESDGLIELLNSAAQDNGVLRPDEESGIASTLLPECATVTVDTLSSPKTITIEFDATGNGCLCDDWDGKYRKGKIIASWSGKYRDAGTVITVATQDYYVNGNKHEYAKSVTNNGFNTAGHLTFSINVTQAKVTYTDGTFSQWVSTRTREWMEGEPTLTPYDDVYSITGTASGTSRNGTPFTVTITNPLDVALSCKWIRKGTIVIQPDGLPSRTLDFGNGTCDSQATVEINGTTYNINL